MKKLKTFRRGGIRSNLDLSDFPSITIDELSLQAMKGTIKYLQQQARILDAKIRRKKNVNL